MKRTVVAIAIFLALVASAAAQERAFTARLSGDQEVPPVTTATTGKSEVVFNADATKARFELEVRQGVRVTQAHIHCAPAGVNGPIVVFLAGFHARGWDLNGSWVENATFTDANVMPPAADSPCPAPIADLRDLLQAAVDGHLYVNVHTVANPGGEIRGQLRED
jgi:hypothetical protein